MPRFIWHVATSLALIGWLCALKAESQENPPGKEEAAKPPSLMELAKLYRELGLPQPSKEARLVRVSYDRWAGDHYYVDRSDSQFAFEEDGKTRSRKSVIWFGLNKRPVDGIEERYDTPPDPETILRHLKWQRLGHNVFENHNRPELIMAIQCYMHEYFDLARFFLWRCQKASPEPLDRQLVQLGLDYWVRQAQDPKLDRVPALARLKQFRQRKEVHSDPDAGSYERLDSFIASMDLALLPSQAKPNSIEAMIDTLRDCARIEGTAYDDDSFQQLPRIQRVQLRFFDPKAGESEAILRLSRMGFEAVPALIEHVDDQRLTRKQSWRSGDPRRGAFAIETFECVGDEARRILSMYFDFAEYGYSSGPNGSKVWKVKKDDYAQKWNSIKLRNDYEYILGRVQDPSKIDSDLMLDFILHKNLDNYKLVYSILLNKKASNEVMHSLIDKIVNSRLSKKEKIDLLLEAARHPSPRVQLAALYGLVLFDNPLFSRTCLEVLEKQSAKPVYLENFVPHLEFARLALYSLDRKVTSKVVDYTKKLPLREKMSVLGDLGYSMADKLELCYFLSQFLDDKASCTIENVSDYFYCGSTFGFDGIEVRNLAASQFILAWKINFLINEKTSERDWEDIRKMVKEEIERQLEQGKRK